jgi:branched-subunit amino acid ABC-type transport system permease component
VINAAGVNIWLAMVLSALAMVAYALAAEFILWRPMRQKRATDTTLIILSLGLALFMRNAIILVWGASNQRYNLPVSEALRVNPRISLFDLLVLGLAAGCLAGLRYLLLSTQIGQTIRAAGTQIGQAIKSAGAGIAAKCITRAKDLLQDTPISQAMQAVADRINLAWAPEINADRFLGPIRTVFLGLIMLIRLGFIITVFLGLNVLIRNALTLIAGIDSPLYKLLTGVAMELNLRIPLYNLLVIAMAAAAMGGLHYLLQNTKIGKAMRAVADDIDLARVTGINVDRVVIWTWVMAAGLTALGGSMLGLVETVRPNMGWFLILPLFAAVVLGGIGNPYGAIAGGLIIGIAQEVGTGMGDFLAPWAKDPQLGQLVGLLSHIFSAQYKAGIALVIMMLVLLVKPQGLFKGTM